MAILLDTQALIWALFDDPRLSDQISKLIADSDIAYVSVASIYEIDFKRRDPARARAARDDLLLRMPPDLPAFLPGLDYVLLPIDAEVAWRAARLPIDHGDPWDRIILTQAMLLGVPLISADRALARAASAHPDTAGVIVF
ncbi:type II toxin-antitoxin system VapC family toxin [uncultured Brevundimonas sp.]|uniref:type II toxin-antitoxin system VapC family toxin n=1 Tax=uncultured Brevundimonas sp. TaxID=213418 RepID=UPI002632ABB6|nr:type II toxin-antitoxin system VapC family toxin [uncultured Brevundimonas sp.]